jgi:hypothetical protein
LEERKVINEGEKIQINVDFTSCEDNFLILSASVPLSDDKFITLYWNTRKYPKKKNGMSQTKMEGAFIRRLRHILSKKYQYIIVADRGFGNDRFMRLCENNNFDFVLRLNNNLNIIMENDNNINNVKNINTDNKFKAKIPSWNNIERYFTVKRADDNIGDDKEPAIWRLISDNGELDAFSIYSKRFKIEKIYQDFKSSGYNIEGSKIRKYDRFRRLLYIVTLAHCLTCFLGDIIQKTKNNLKKNFNECAPINSNLISAFLESDIKLYPSIFKSPFGYLRNICYTDSYELNEC